LIECIGCCLLQSFDLPKVLLGERYRATGLMGLCALLRRYALRDRQIDVARRIHRGCSFVCALENAAAHHIMARYGHLLRSPAHLLTQDWLAEYASSILDKGSVYDKSRILFAFIDGDFFGRAITFSGVWELCICMFYSKLDMIRGSGQQL